MPTAVVVLQKVRVSRLVAVLVSARRDLALWLLVSESG